MWKIKAKGLENKSSQQLSISYNMLADMSKIPRNYFFIKIIIIKKSTALWKRKEMSKK